MSDIDNYQSVIISYYYGYEELDQLHELAMKLDQAIENAKVGIYDGHEINMDGTDGTIFMYGPSAEELYKVVKPILEETDFMYGATAHLRFGSYKDENAKEIELKIILKHHQ